MKHQSILIIDDDSSSRELLITILRNLEYSVIKTAHDGSVAMRIYGNFNPSIVFLDIEMPEQDGFQVLSQLQKKNPDQYIVMVSAHSTMDNVKKALDMGAKGFIVKPYTTGKVKDIMEKYVRDMGIAHKSKAS